MALSSQFGNKLTSKAAIIHSQWAFYCGAIPGVLLGASLALVIDFLDYFYFILLPMVGVIFFLHFKYKERSYVWTLSLVVFLLFTGNGILRYMDHLGLIDQQWVSEHKVGKVEILGKVIKVSSFQYGKHKLIVDPTQIDGVSVRGEGHLLLQTRFKPMDIYPDTCIEVKGSLFWNTNEQSYADYLRTKGIVGTVFVRSTNQINIMSEPGFSLRRIFHAQVEATRDKFKKHIGGHASSLSFALLTGDKRDLPSSVKENFRKTGVYHVLAVSGMHAGILSVIFFSFLRFFHFSRALALNVVVGLVFPVFLFFTGMPISIIRTFLMAFVGLVVIRVGRPLQPMALLLFVFTLVAVIDPMQVYSISTQLSFSAVLGIFLVLPLIKRWQIKRLFFQGIWVSIGAQSMTTPFLLYYFGYIHWLTVLYNIPIAILITLSLVLSFMLLVSPIEGVSEILGNALFFLNQSIFSLLDYTLVELKWNHIPLQGRFIECVLLFFITLALWLVFQQWKKN